jgi:hypothetical protein
MADHSQRRPVEREHVCAEARWGAKSLGLPVRGEIVRGRKSPGDFRGQNAEQNVGPFDKVCIACDYYRRTNFGFYRARQLANHDIAGIQ